MAKGEAKKSNQMNDQNIASNTAFRDNYQQSLINNANEDRNTNTNERTAIMDGYGDLAKTGGVTDADRNTIKGLYNNLKTPTWNDYDKLPDNFVTGTGTPWGTGAGGGYSAPARVSQDYTYGGNIQPTQDTYTELMKGNGVNRYALPALNELSGKNGGWDQPNIDTMNRGIGGFESIGSTGGYNSADKSTLQNDISQMRSSGTLDSGLMDNLRQGVAGFGEIGRTGGWSDQGKNLVSGEIANMQGLKNLDPATMKLVNQGLSGYSELANNGGWDNQRKADYMNTATGVIPAMYSQADRSARQQANVQGGSPGLSYALRNNMKAQAASAQDAARQGRLGMENSIDANKQTGYAGLTGAGLNTAQAMNDAAMRSAMNAASTQSQMEQSLTSNRLAGLGGQSQYGLSGAQAISDAAYRAGSGASSAQQQMMQNEVSNKLAGLGGMTSNVQGMQDSMNQTRLNATGQMNDLTKTDLSAKLSGAQGSEGIIGKRADESYRNMNDINSWNAQQAAASASSSNQAAEDAYKRQLYALGYNKERIDNMNTGGQTTFGNQMDINKFGAGLEGGLIDTTNTNRLAGLSGMSDMYGRVGGIGQQGVENVLNNRQVGNTGIQNGINSRMQYNPNTSFMQGLGNTLNTVGNVAGSVMGGLGSLGGRRPPQTGGFTGWGSTPMQGTTGSPYGTQFVPPYLKE